MTQDFNKMNYTKATALPPHAFHPSASFQASIKGYVSYPAC